MVQRNYYDVPEDEVDIDMDREDNFLGERNGHQAENPGDTTFTNTDYGDGDPHLDPALRDQDALDAYRNSQQPNNSESLRAFAQTAAMLFNIPHQSQVNFIVNKYAGVSKICVRLTH